MSPLNSSCNHGEPEGWAEHMEDFKHWSATTDAMHNIISSMHHDTKHLAVLPEVVKELRSMRESLIGPATNRNFVPLAPILAVLAFMSLALVLVGTMALSQVIPIKTVKLPNMEIQAQ